MGEITDWSNEAELGYQSSTAPPDGAPENHNASQTNNIIREVMAACRRQWEDSNWFDYGDPPSFLSTTQFTIDDTFGEFYTVGRRIRVTQDATPTDYFGSVNTVTGSGTLTVTVTMDNLTPLNSNISAVAFGVPVEASPSAGFVLGDQILMPNQTAAAPSYSWVAKPDTGHYLNAGVSPRVSVDGSDVIEFAAAGTSFYTQALASDGDLTNPGLSFLTGPGMGFKPQDANRLDYVSDGAVRATFGNSNFKIFEQLQLASGSVGAPSLGGSSDSNTGVNFEGGDVLSLVTGGANRLTIDDTSVTALLKVRAPGGSPSNASYAFSNDINSGMWADAAGVWHSVDGASRYGVERTLPWIFQVPSSGNTANDEFGGLYVGLSDFLGSGGGNDLSGLWISGRRGEGDNDDPNGGFIVGRASGGVGWATSLALRWSEARQKWYIGPPGFDVVGPKYNIMTEDEIQALIDASIAAHVAALH